MSVLLLLKRFLNWIIVLCLITPATVSYWRGTWYILDLFVLPDDQVSSAWLTFAAGSEIIYSIVLVEDYLKAFLNQRKARKMLCLMFYSLSIMIIAFWRGVWMLLDYYTTTSPASFCCTHIIGFLIVLSTKTTSSIITVPGYCISERYAEPSAIVLAPKNYFRKTSISSYCADIAARMLNSFITVYIIGAAVVSYWRGTWNIVRYIKHPNDIAISSVLAMSVGYAISSICYCLSDQNIATEKLNPPYPWWFRALEQTFVYILGFGVVSTWVGLWCFEDTFLLPDRPVASALVCHFAGIAILYLLQGSVNLISSPAGCRVHQDTTLEGLDMGSYLNREVKKGTVQKQKSLNLTGSPAGCRIHPDTTLEGLDMGSYLNRELEKGTVQKHKISEVYKAINITESANKELDATQN